jgi:hypothetical protein
MLRACGVRTPLLYMSTNARRFGGCLSLVGTQWRRGRRAGGGSNSAGVWWRDRRPCFRLECLWACAPTLAPSSLVGGYSRPRRWNGVVVVRRRAPFSSTAWTRRCSASGATTGAKGSLLTRRFSSSLVSSAKDLQSLSDATQSPQLARAALAPGGASPTRSLGAARAHPSASHRGPSGLVGHKFLYGARFLGACARWPRGLLGVDRGWRAGGFGLLWSKGDSSSGVDSWAGSHRWRGS